MKYGVKICAKRCSIEYNRDKLVIPEFWIVLYFNLILKLSPCQITRIDKQNTCMFLDFIDEIESNVVLLIDWM